MRKVYHTCMAQISSAALFGELSRLEKSVAGIIQQPCVDSGEHIFVIHCNIDEEMR